MTASHTPAHHPIFRQFPTWEGEADGRYRINFLGVKTSTRFTQADVAPPLGFLQPALPHFNEEYFEWIDLLESVHQATDEFVMIELGAGYGRWLANAIGALRASRNLPYTLIGVEAEPSHFMWMKEHLEANAADFSRCTLYEAAAAPREGHLWFHVGQAESWYGQEIARNAWLYKLRKLFGRGPLANGRQLKKVKAIGLEQILQPLRSVDLIDLDVQGAEFDVLESAAAQLGKVRRLHIGTHSSEIEGSLRQLFRRLGWRSVHDYGCGQECETPYGRISFQDGVQSWLNPDLA